MIGIDFDNTIVCYDGLFQQFGRQEGLLAESCGPTKHEVKQHLIDADREEDWTRLQGLVYGEQIDAAAPFAGVVEFFAAARLRSLPVAIVSHRTRRPCLGADIDMHAAAHRWLERHLPNAPASSGELAPAYFEETKADKLRRIRELGCEYFIDDLPEFLAEADFPAGVERILFDPQRRYTSDTRFRRAGSWSDIAEMVL